MYLYFYIHVTFYFFSLSFARTSIIGDPQSKNLKVLKFVSVHGSKLESLERNKGWQQVKKRRHNGATIYKFHKKYLNMSWQHCSLRALQVVRLVRVYLDHFFAPSFSPSTSSLFFGPYQPHQPTFFYTKWSPSAP